MNDIPILIGDSESVIVELITELVAEVIGEDNHAVVFSSGYGEDLRQFARNNKIRIFCLTVNNVMFRAGLMSYEKRVGKVLELVTEVKRDFRIPVIISGTEGMITENVRTSDADAVIISPFKLDDYRAILKKFL